ncbi:MAG TPA: LPS-assembly protein LptD [Candidatus Omnitrophica bacterium]|nr:LPS-assembly protein LptD [Candidatus Omnitrophota bacterium]
MRKIFFLIFLSICFYLFAQHKLIPVVIDADEINYLHQDKKIVAKKNVKVEYKDVELFCDEVEYDTQKNIAYIKGKVKIVRKDALFYGENIVYDFNKKEIQANKTRIESPPIYGEAEKAERKEERYILKEGYITTCDLKKPHYRLVAKKVIIYPKERIIAKNMVLKAGNLPLFYFPYYSHSLKDKSSPYQIIPGKDSKWGFYLLNRWRYYFNENNKGKIHFDFYEKRGEGGGFTHRLKTNMGEILLNYYFIEDELYSLDKRKELIDYYPERKDTIAEYLEDDRYKAQIYYFWQPTPYFSIRSEVNKFSDKDFMHDFFYREYEKEPHPLTYTLFDYALNNSSLSLLVQKRMNHFFTETEYLSQLEYNLYRQNLGKSNFYWESKTTLGNLTYKVANSDLDYDAVRFHSHNILSFSKNIKWLYFNPYIGNYFTFYSKNSFGDENTFRVAPEIGLNLSTKLYRVFGVNFNFFQKIEKIRHIITPQIQYHYIHSPTVSKDHLFSFDNIDDLERKEAVVFILDSKLQAKNKEKVWDFVYFSPSLEYQINKEGKGSYFNKMNMDLEIYPREGISLVSDAEYDFLDRAFKEVNLDIDFSDTKNNKYSVKFGHRYLRKESSQTTVGLTYQITSKLQFKNYLRYEYKKGDFKEQQYALRVDLHCWWLDYGVNIDDDKSFTFWVIFRLKAFPDIHIGFDHTYHGAKKEY